MRGPRESDERGVSWTKGGLDEQEHVSRFEEHGEHGRQKIVLVGVYLKIHLVALKGRRSGDNS